MTFARDGGDQGLLLVPSVGPGERQRRQDARLARGAVVRGSGRAVAPRTFHYDTGDEVIGQSNVVHRPDPEPEPALEPEGEPHAGPYNLRARLLEAERLVERRSGYRSSPGLRRLQEHRVNRTLAIVARWLHDMMTPPEIGGDEYENNTLLGLSKHVLGQVVELTEEAP